MLGFGIGVSVSVLVVASDIALAPEFARRQITRFKVQGRWPHAGHYGWLALGFGPAGAGGKKGALNVE